MKLIVLLFSGLFSVAGFSQIYFGTSHEFTEAKIFKKQDDNYHTNIIIKNPEAGYKQCQNDHSTIIKLIQNTQKKQIIRILDRMNSLSKTKEFDGITKQLLRTELLEKIVHHMILNEMNKELMSKNLKEVAFDDFSKSRKNLKIFEMKYKNINVEAYFNDAIKSAQAYKADQNLPNWFIEEVISSLKVDILKQFAKNSFRVMVNGVAIEIGKKIVTGVMTKQAIQAGLKSAAISFTGKVLASVGERMLIEILTMPLKGNRLPPETLWLNLLDEHPGLILNPEIMREAGINDGAWSTHCHTINRRAHSLEQRIGKLQKYLRDETTSVLKVANEMNDRLKYDEIYPRAKVDNTYVAPRRVFPAQ